MGADSPGESGVSWEGAGSSGFCNISWVGVESPSTCGWRAEVLASRSLDLSGNLEKFGGANAFLVNFQ